jgi:hypothetical protein
MAQPDAFDLQELAPQALNRQALNRQQFERQVPAQQPFVAAQEGQLVRLPTARYSPVSRR